VMTFKKLRRINF